MAKDAFKHVRVGVINDDLVEPEAREKGDYWPAEMFVQLREEVDAGRVVLRLFRLDLIKRKLWRWQRHCCGLSQRARAARLAISERSSGVKRAARAFPPFKPPRRPSACACSVISA